MGGRSTRLRRFSGLMTKQFKILKERMPGEARARTLKRAEELLAEEGSPTIQNLVSEVEASFVKVQERAGSERGDGPVTSEDELESLVGEVLRKVRRQGQGSGE
jgi:hypothetical protein